MKKRKIAAAVAAVIAANALMSMPFSSSAAEIKIECESGTLTGTGGVKTDVAGYSGDGYMYLEDNADVIDIPVTVDAAGMYELKVCYNGSYGDKIQNIHVNGVDAGQMSFPENTGWEELSFGAVKLNAGENTISIVGSWGWTNFDYITITEASLSEIKATQTNTCDPDASEATKQLMAYLASVYGKHIISGQQEIYAYGPHDYEYEFEYIYEKTGHYPAIRGFDYGNFCCPAFGSDDGQTDRIIAWAKRGGIVTSSFHLNVPTDFASYTTGDKVDWAQTTYSEKTDFSPSKAATEGTKENIYYTTALDTLAKEFNKLEEMGIPVIWRPLHEAEGGGGENGSWFWWGREGSKAYRELWIYTYKYLTEEKNCHNLIWEWNSYAFSTSQNWYPGDQYVDIIGYDKYNCTDWSSGSPVLKHNDSAISSTFYTIMDKYNSAKMISMAENDCFSTVENLTSEKAGWLYFCTWYDGGSDDINFLSNPVFNTEKDLIDMYTSDYCITLDELPDFGTIDIDPDATNPTENTEPTAPEEGHASITIDDKTGNFTLDFPKASDRIYLNVELNDGVDYANGGLGVTVEVDGKYYWANIMWVATKSGEVEVNLVKDLLNITLTEGDEVIEIEKDSDVWNAVVEALTSKKSFQGQKWYAGSGEDEADTASVVIKDAYIKEAGEGTTDPVEDTTAPSEEDTTLSSEDPIEGIYGDVDGNGTVNLVDVVLLNKHLMVGTELSEVAKNITADVDRDGKLSAVDALNILKACIDLVTLPVA